MKNTIPKKAKKYGDTTRKQAYYNTSTQGQQQHTTPKPRQT